MTEREAFPNLWLVNDSKTQRRQFGRRLKARRTEKNLTLTGFARDVGVAPPTALGWEKGDYSPSLGSLRRIAAVLDTTVDELIEAA